MPDISHALDVMKATVFLYPSVEDAEKGQAFGGSGLVVGMPAANRPDIHYLYVVSNWHVVCDGGGSVVRFLDRSGQVHIWETDPSEWTFIPGGPDLAAIPARVVGLDPIYVPLMMFTTASEVGNVLLGDDIFMAGRFIDYDGNETNQPALRFGAISMMGVPIRQPTGYLGPSYVVDMHSRTGFSGSPVYVYRPGNATSAQGGFLMNYGETSSPPTLRSWGVGNNTFIRLLGIQWGQFPEAWEINHPDGEPDKSAALITDGAYVKGLSGMSCVIPADDICHLLDLPELAKERNQTFVNVPIAEGLGFGTDFVVRDD